ncbi:hypothetical protein CN172_04390 [Sinorhizobium meliloti]|uniref:hypothetical protein n=1 Tax=Rhizobium meliloti TaxID=382 RepID=UPI000FD9FCBC|nr:hypothetical protein [Sinorhizobium meliloti]RVG01634.1 hypothetical protein CN232_08900 [Sinorhizobium meliloti]RVH46557.1 hypothetical protein CN208_07045 [Sinorhizobium meliloti]RVK20077.1 hypothetical protein CN172_04390 [Sinorhizobium meliloti]
MPNSSVSARAEGLPRFNLSQIMRDAWGRYREIRRTYGAWQIERGIVDASFSSCLKTAWRVAKAAAAEAARPAKIDALLLTPAADRIRALQEALEQTQYLSFRYRAADHRAAIEREINALIEEAA